MTDAADTPALDPRVWGVRPAPPALSRAEQAAAVIEEQVLYPEARDRVPKAADEVLEALEEHHIVKWTLSELESTTPRTSGTTRSGGADGERSSPRQAGGA